MSKHISILISLVLLLLATGCIMEQEQSVKITADQLGSAAGRVYLLCAPDFTSWTPGSHENHTCGCNFSGDWEEELYTIWAPDELPRVTFTYAGGNAELQQACAEDTTCQTSATDTVDPQGNFTVANLLVGAYEIDATHVDIGVSSGPCTDHADFDFRVDAFRQTIGQNTQVDVPVSSWFSGSEVSGFTCQ